jgi:hypothetical protein
MAKLERDELNYQKHHSRLIENNEPYDDFSGREEDSTTESNVWNHATDLPFTKYKKPRPADDDDWKTDDEQADDDIIHVEQDHIDPSLILHSKALNDFESQSPLNAAIVKALRAIGKVNYSAIARMVNEMGVPTNHDAVRRLIIKLVQSVKAAKALQDLEHSWYRYSHFDGQSKAAREAVIPEVVPEFLQREFNRTGPITQREHLKWQKYVSPLWVKNGLTHSVLTLELPEDTGPYWSHSVPSRKPTR